MNIAVAFIAGLLTFFTPCVFPLIPSYLSYVTGLSLVELSSGDKKLMLKKSISSILFFIAGFTMVFVMLGVAASYAGSFIYDLQGTLRLIGGVIIIFFGVTMTGLLNIRFLEIEKRFNIKSRPAGYSGAFLIGMTFAAGWVPCVGPILSSMLIIASTSGSRLYGGIMLFSYCMGLGIPIFVSAVAFNWFLSIYKGIVKYLRVISVIGGVILIIAGFLLITDNLTAVSAYISYLFGFKGL